MVILSASRLGLVFGFFSEKKSPLLRVNNSFSILLPGNREPNTRIGRSARLESTRSAATASNYSNNNTLWCSNLNEVSPLLNIIDTHPPASRWTRFRAVLSLPRLPAAFNDHRRFLLADRYARRGRDGILSRREKSLLIHLELFPSDVIKLL